MKKLCLIMLMGVITTICGCQTATPNLEAVTSAVGAVTPLTSTKISTPSPTWTLTLARTFVPTITSTTITQNQEPHSIQIAYIYNRILEPSSLYLVDLDGKNKLRLIGEERHITDFKWSPNGQWILAEVDYRNLYLVHIDSRGLRKILEAEGDIFGIDWSPDGQHIVFASEHNGNQEIFIMDVEGTNKSQITNNAVNDVFPDWSPIGNLIAFVRRPSVAEREDIYLFDLEIGQERQLISAPEIERDPLWSPDGEWIAFAAFGDNGWQIHVMDAEGNNRMKIADTYSNIPKGNLGYSWSPDSTQIVFVDARARYLGLYVIHRDGSNVRRLTSFAFDRVRSPAWSPDGEWVAFMAGDYKVEGQWGIYLVRADGTELQLLSDFESSDSSHEFPAWRP